MKKNLAKAYQPEKYENKTYQKWETSGKFNPDNLGLPKEAEHYSIAMPPPNVTGVLHLGHALENSIMDIQARVQRMKGKRVLLIPGTDHAAVATQAKVEKNLIQTGLKSPRQQLGREKLLKEIRQYAEDSKTTIIRQIKQMGTSCDWSRLAYTFDEQRSKAVNEVFVKMFNDGLIEKDYRVINWSVKGQSTCSDDELEHHETKTTLYTFKYSPDFPIAISTTRPETKLGDTAVAVHPKDKRYQKYVGKTFTVDVGAKKPLQIKIITDQEIDPDFGTGALGVTPAHSQIDFEMKEKNDLELIPVIDQTGKMNENAGKDYAGLTVGQAREKFVQWLKNEDLMEKEEEITHNVSASDRFGDVIEPLPMKQWFVRVNKKIPGREKTLKDLMREAISADNANKKSEKIKITPDRFNNQYLHWIDNLRDWCISRQVWWGHQIPVWYRANEVYCGLEAPTEKGWQRDPDTLDTWFSSGLWTFSTLGWPEETADFKNFHPTAWMQMGYDLLFFWMARMILMSTYVTKDIPFKKVYLHGLLRDAKGQKFSKSLGNNVDPMDIIKKYGTDALRLSLVLGISPGNDSRFFEEKVEGSRNLVNKLWNISRYIISLSQTGKIGKIPELVTESLTAADHWILDRTKQLIQAVDRDFERYNFSAAGERLRDFTWNELADWYLEVSKFEDNKTEKLIILNHILRDLLKLWHPFIPFVTEKIWENLAETLLMTEQWPEPKAYPETKTNKIKLFNQLKSLIIAIRNLRAENKIRLEKKVEVIVYAGAKTAALKEQAVLLEKMRTNIGKITLKETGPKIKQALYQSMDEMEIYIPLAGLVDLKKEKTRIQKELLGYEKFTEQLEKKLSNQQFIRNAPPEIVAGEKEKLKSNRENIKKLKNYLQNLG